MNTEYEKLEKCILCGSGAVATFDARLLLSRCGECGHVFDNPRPTLDAISGYYSEKGKYDPWLRNEESLSRQWANLLSRIRRFKPSGELLDIGAGIGHFLSLAKKYYNVSGTEISSEGVAIAKEKYGVELVRGEIEEADFKGDTFDIITMHQVLEHVQYPGRVIESCRSLLREDGVFYLSVPNEAAYSLRMIFPVVMKLLGRKKYGNFSWRGYRKIDFDTMEEIHLSHYSEPTLRTVLERKGFRVIESNIDFIDPLMYGKPPVQIVRHCSLFAAKILRSLFGINSYNCFWIAARKTGKEP